VGQQDGKVWPQTIICSPSRDLPTSVVHVIFTVLLSQHLSKCPLYSVTFSLHHIGWVFLSTAPNNIRREVLRYLVVRRRPLSVRPSFVRYCVLFRISPDAISSLSEGILMKLCTDIHRIQLGTAENVFKVRGHIMDQQKVE